MASEYNYNQALGQCNKVSAAYSECESAKQALQSVKQSISENWSGKAGSAMIEALEQWESNLSGIMTRISSLNAKMRQEAWNYQEISVSEE